MIPSSRGRTALARSAPNEDLVVEVYPSQNVTQLLATEYRRYWMIEGS